ncbi:hypothetical protein [Streptomyces chromofuscus]|uniref:Uncharacterized protein n=1 Tax=Streptomyces chromofuscus TaxID=42881 RepID=A0A7M2T1W7_STRCW|nr:hypothetical protein [Streptomyces chromofuscus]QOV41863.1 hypothetical protein IPT68_18345 [Streptomyces chromofuscus]
MTEVTRTCMKRLGFRYRPANSEPREWGAEENRRYGIQDPARAAAYGYRPISVVHPPEESKTEYSDAEVAALSGRDKQGKALAQGAKASNGEPIPSGGCSGEADRTVRVPYDYAKGVAAARTVDFDGFETSLTDPEVEKAFSDWSSCMKAKGYTYATPLAAMGSAEFSKGPISDHERAVAQRDVECKKKVDLIRRWNTAESAIQRSLIKKNKVVLDRFLDLQTAKVAAARKLLGTDD